MPLMFVTYMLQFLDKTTLGNASVLGLIEDTVRFYLNIKKIMIQKLKVSEETGRSAILLV